MKNFLKSTAIFVCAALMMGACTEDDTEDVGGGYVSAPTIESLQAGNEKAVLTWYTPNTNENVTKCQISWVGPSVKGATTQTISTLDASQTYEIKDEVNSLIAGTYTVSIKLMTTTGEESDFVSETVTIYDADSYDVPEIVAAEATDGAVLLTWGDIDADCKSISLSYYDEYGIIYYTTIDEFATDAATVITLPDAAYETQIQYTAYFIPEGGYDYVEKAGTYAIANVPDAPTNVVAKGGLDRFTITWDVEVPDGKTFDDLDLDYALIVYQSDADSLTQKVYTSGDASYLREGTNSYTINDVVAGDYDITIQLYNNSGFSSTADDTDAECNSITVFGEDSYSIATIASIINVNGTIYATINADEVDADCTSLSMSYLYSDYDDQDDIKVTNVDLTEDTSTSGVYSVVITDAFETSQITLSATFCPTGEYFIGDELVIEEVSEYTIPELAPEAPASQTVTLDFNASASWITVSWTLASTSNVEAVRVYYTDEDYVEVTDLDVTSCVISTADGVIEVDNSYTIEVKTVTAGGMTSVAADSFVAKPYNYSSYTNLDMPTPSATTEINASGDGIVVISWSNVHEDLKKITVVYNDITYTYELNEDGVFEVNTDILYVLEVNSYTFTPTFYPDGGLTANEPANSTVYSFDLSDIAPTAPSGVTVTTGLTDSGDSKVTINWALTDADNITDLYVYYYTGTNDADSILYTGAYAGAFEVADDYTMDIEGLATGTYSDPTTYTFYVKSYNSVILMLSDSSDEVIDIAPYTKSGYFTSPTISSLDYADGIITINWGDTMYSGLTNVDVSYSQYDSSAAKVVSIPVYTGKINALELENPIPGTAVTFVSTFLPTGAEDIASNYVYVDSTESYSIPSVASNYSARASVVANGNVYDPVILAEWTLEETSNVAAQTIYYKKSTESTYTTLDVAVGSDGDSYSISIPTTYTGLVYDVYLAVVQNDTDATEYTTAVETLTTYGSADYMNSVPPTVASLFSLKGEVTVQWSGYESLSSTLNSISIVKSDGTVIETTLYADLADGTVFTTADLGTGVTTFGYNANFAPTGATEYVVKNTSGIDLPNATPTDPTYTQNFVTGYDSTGAYIRVWWDVETDDGDLYQTAIAFTESGATEPTYIKYFTSSDFATLMDTDGDGCKIYVSDDSTGKFSTDTPYTMEVYNISSTSTKSNNSINYTAMTLYDEASYTTNPTSVSLFFNDDSSDVTFDWSNLYSDITDFSITYNGVTYDLRLYNGVVCQVGSYTEFSLAGLVDASVTAYSYSVTICPSGGETVTQINGSSSIYGAYELVSGVYQIYNATGLSYFADVVNGTNGVTQNLSASGKLMLDIDLSSVCGAGIGSWTPIGDYFTSTSNIYKGTFDGNDKTISNLYINETFSSTCACRGLFGYVSGATIKNVNLANVDMSVGGTVSLYSGALVGYATGSTAISYCEITSGTVTYSTTAAAHSGALVGRITNTTIEYCVNRADVTCATQQVGGIVGNTYSGITGTAGTTSYIRYCTNYGKIDAVNFAGGIAGYFFCAGASEMIDCYNYGVVTGTANLGGITGSVRASGTVTSTVTGCINYATGTVTSSGQYVGGITGQVSNNTGTVIMTDCENYADIYSSSSSGCVGGVIGSQITEPTNGCYSLFTNLSNSGNVEGTKSVGGIIGAMLSVATLTGDATSSSYNYGTVTGTNSATNGGIIGSNAGTVSNYINMGAVIVSGSNKNGADANGIYGTNSGTVTNCFDNYSAE